MRVPCTAIIHLREPAFPRIAMALDRLERVIHGVEHVEFDVADGLVAVDFDEAKTGIAEIVRVIEDSGTVVAGVARRSAGFRKAG